MAHQKTYDELAQDWADEIAASELERQQHAEAIASMQAKLAAMQAKLEEYEAVIGALAFRHGGVRLRRDEVAANHPFSVGVDNGDLVIMRVM